MKILALLCLLLASGAVSAADVSFSLVKTGHTHAYAGMVYSGGGFSRKLEISHVAVLVRHGQDSFLFDSGLGRKVAGQYAQDMPWWARPAFRYEPPVTPARDQLDAAGIAVSRIILSHSHWDHASALVDFPQAEVWVTPEERAFDQGEGLGFPGAFPSQVGDPAIRWHVYRLDGGPVAGFERSLDLYGDGSAVLLPLSGHTPGAVGLLLTVASGRQYLFCGDTVWSAEALQDARPKSFLASLIADHDRVATQRAIERLQALTRQRPELVVVPAHDAALHQRLGWFPQWVR